MFKSGSGRKFDDNVWKYFKYEAASDRSVCSVHMTDGSDGSTTCGVVLKGKNATNLKNHIRFKHKHLMHELEESNRITKNTKLENINNTKVGVFSSFVITFISSSEKFHIRAEQTLIFFQNILRGRRHKQQTLQQNTTRK